MSTATAGHVLCTSTRDDVRVVPIEEWGVDHWRLLLYVETRCVDHRGVLRNENLSCNTRRHRKFSASGRTPIMDRTWHDRYSTRLASGSERGHDDFDSIEDMAAAGLLTFEYRDTLPSYPFAGGKLTVTLLDPGYALAQELRKHRARTGGVGGFRSGSADV